MQSKKSERGRFPATVTPIKVFYGLILGSVSISVTLHQTTFCFVSTHLTSGEKEGDEVHRNSDVIEILKKMKFSQSQRVSGQPFSPSHVSILEHDHTIWLGDLNYRLAFPSGDTEELLENKDWQTLLKKDQLMIEQRAGRVFKGWEEGSINFPPTYKYLDNSDKYIAQTSKSKEMRRTPAWCDRILWKGKGMKQMWYVRGESKFSDHRHVYSMFSVQLDSPIGGYKVQKPTITTTTTPSSSSPAITTTTTTSTSTKGMQFPTASVAKIQAEELLLRVYRSTLIIEGNERSIAINDFVLLIIVHSS